MQVASRQVVWNAGGRGTVIEVEMTPTTGLYIKFFTGNERKEPFTVSWGDGSGTQTFVFDGHYHEVEHSFRTYGRYRIVFTNITNVGFRWLDGQPHYAYDAAILSIVDYAGTLTGAHSGAFSRCENLERYIAPNNRGCGQRPFAYCTKLKEVQLGECGIHYDGSFQGCSALEKFTTVSTGCCWSYVWEGCTKIRELRLGAVEQFATRDFNNTPNLMDIWIGDKTVDQIRQVAPSGNIVAGYGAMFPWNANPLCRFHGTDGIVLGNGTVIHE